MAISRYSSFSVVFPVFRPTFLSLGPFLGATPLREKKIDILKLNFMLDILKKKIFFLNLQEQKSSSDPENFRWSHQ